MDMKSHLKTLGLILSLMFLVTVVTAIVALRLRSDITASEPDAPPPAASTATGAGHPAPAVQSAAPGGGVSRPAGGQCSSGASSLVEDQALQGGISTGLGSLSMPSGTASAP